MPLILMMLPLELWYEVLDILTASSSRASLSDEENRMMLRTLRGMSQTCKDLHILCAPWWYRKARALPRKPSDPLNCLLINATSHGNVQVLRQAVDAGFAPCDLQEAAFSFGLDPTGRLGPLHEWTPLSIRCEGNLAEISILGEAAPHQKVLFLKWLFNLGVPLGYWYTRKTGSLRLLAAGVGELEVIRYLTDTLPTQSLFVDDPQSLFGAALKCKAPNETLEYLMRRLRPPNSVTRQAWFQVAINNQSYKCLDFLVAHEKSLGVCGKKATRDVLHMALDATLHQRKNCNGSIEILNLVLRWSLGKLPDAKKRHIHYPIWNFTSVLRYSRPRKRRMLAYIIKRLAENYRITWTNTSAGNEEPWSFVFLEDCVCRQGCLEEVWLKFFKLLYHHTPQRVCRSRESRYRSNDGAEPLRLVVDLAFSDAYHVTGLCRCRRRILEFLIDRGEIDVNGGRGTALGTPLHTFCENVFRMRSRGWFEGGPRSEVRFREVCPLLGFLAAKGCDVAAPDQDGRTAPVWFVDGAQMRREEGQGEWALYLESRPDLYYLTMKAFLLWPTDDATKAGWDYWIDCHARAQK